jgi:hypothetical protein
MNYYLNPKNWFLKGKDASIAKLESVLTGEELQRALLRLEDTESHEFKLGMLNLDVNYNHITQHQYDKDVATLTEEPYIRVINMELDPKNPGAGHFELDFNEHFVEYLANSGYEGVEPDQIVDNWFNDLCRNIVLSDLEDDAGDPKSFDVTSKEGLIIQRLKTGEDSAEYS